MSSVLRLGLIEIVKGGGLLMYIREDIPSRQLFCKSQYYTEAISAEINLKKRKWFLNRLYNPHRNSISNQLDSLNSIIDEYIETYDNFLFIEDFNGSVIRQKGESQHRCFKKAKQGIKNICFSEILACFTFLKQLL